jgi:hypothetical protein
MTHFLYLNLWVYIKSSLKITIANCKINIILPSSQWWTLKIHFCQNYNYNFIIHCIVLFCNEDRCCSEKCTKHWKSTTYQEHIIQINPTLKCCYNERKSLNNIYNNHFINLVYSCVSSPCFSVIINGQPYAKFKSQRGIRQGCPCLLIFLLLL